jgi:hypothetical protein
MTIFGKFILIEQFPAIIEAYAKRGFAPMCMCHVPSIDGRGAIAVAFADANESQDDIAANEEAEKTVPPSVNSVSSSASDGPSTLAAASVVQQFNAQQPSSEPLLNPEIMNKPSA